MSNQKAIATIPPTAKDARLTRSVGFLVENIVN